MKISELIESNTSDNKLDEIGLVQNIIDECIFAFLVSLDTKFNPLILKNILLEHFEIEENDE